MTGTGFLELIITCVTLMFGIISIIGSMIFRLCYRRRIDLEYLGWGIVLAAVWNIANSGLGQVLFQTPSATANITVFATILMPLPFFLYINEVQKGRYQRIYKVAEILLFVEVIVFLGLHFLHLRDITKNLSFSVIFLVLFILIVFLTMLADIYHGRIREYLVVAAGMLCMWIATFVRIISYICKVNVKGDAVLPAGLIILLVLAAANTVRELLNMEKKKQQALMASEAKGKFLANMSHEIRTPINAVLGMDAMILRECTDATIREYALDIQNAGQSLLALINDILDLSKIESGKLEILPEEYDLSSLLHDIMNMITMKAKDKGLAVNLSVDENLPSRFWGDDIRLRQILINIMNNAVKYTETGSVTLTVRSAATESGDSIDSSISDDSAPENGTSFSLLFQVEDTGIGIRQEDIAKLFGEFERIEEERNRNIEGTGLGMSITTQLLEMMGSKLQVESVYGEGSKFYFTLEQKAIDMEPIGNLGERIRRRATEYSYQVAFTAKQAQVLVVDDNSVNRKVFVSLLKATKVMIDEAAGGMECLKMAGQKQYDVIFLDHMMPDLNGIETLHRLRTLEDCPNHSTPVVALTANAVSGAREMYLKEGFDSFLSKPIIPDKLEKMLMEMLPEDRITYEEIIDDSSKNMAGNEEADFVQSGESSQTDELPQIDGIDWEYALLHLKDMGILKEVVNNFYFAMAREADELMQFFQMLQGAPKEQYFEAMEQFEIKVHAMKSASAMIGAVSLSGVARMLEYAAKDGNIEMILSVTPVFLEEWQKMKERLEPYVEVGTDEAEVDKPMAELSVLPGQLRQIVEAMQDLDIDTADEIMVQIQEFRYPKSLIPAMEKLGAAVTDIDAEQAAKWVEELEGKIKEMEEK